ncbi:hypothetical protein SLEP1_g22497 [Rubroshorea leprosula]|uniref:Uncharacterized protein n=1 Tax=Rubroshorea leprosula TaxID=152421 RepID=A0AAV5J9D9_9ROSI|nr:hypothetical protein SLEP1_g22497 [Rubroshorea leprosula]
MTKISRERGKSRDCRKESCIPSGNRGLKFAWILWRLCWLPKTADQLRDRLYVF